MTEGTAEHVQANQLFSLLWASKDKRPPEEGEGADPELLRMFNDMDDRFDTAPPVEHQLGPETAERLWEHAVACDACRLMLLEDGPGARPPKTEAQIEQEVQDKDAARKRLVIKFWIDAVLGLGFFIGAFSVMQYIRGKEVKDTAAATIEAVGPKQIDPLYLLFVALILAASWFLAEGYTIAKELWIDFTAWKRAVPIIGEKWVERDKRKQRGG